MADKCPAASPNTTEYPYHFGSQAKDDLAAIRIWPQVAAAVACLCRNCATFDEVRKWPANERQVGQGVAACGLATSLVPGELSTGVACRKSGHHQLLHTWLLLRWRWRWRWRVCMRAVRLSLCAYVRARVRVPKLAYLHDCDFELHTKLLCVVVWPMGCQPPPPSQKDGNPHTKLV